MPYAVVQDVPASWERYAQIATAIAEESPAGLIMHVAGPTDEGFRTIELWQTREAWQRWHQRSSSPAPAWSPVTLRGLSTLSAIPAADTVDVGRLST